MRVSSQPLGWAASPSRTLVDHANFAHPRAEVQVILCVADVSDRETRVHGVCLGDNVPRVGQLTRVLHVLRQSRLLATAAAKVARELPVWVRELSSQGFTKGRQQVFNGLPTT
jgi:hypothetical protein